MVEENPLDGVEPPKLPKLKSNTLIHEDITALLGTAEKAVAKRRAKALILFLLDTGARAFEVCAVIADDVDFASGRVLATVKGSKQRCAYPGRRALSAT
ncbi:MAG: tyrosine-type recombinase/integrase [Anaerolineae bacterium]